MADFYNYLDSQIMKGVNKGVKAWNYTTGRTKTDLANLLLYVAPVAESAGLIAISSSVAAVFSPIYMYISHSDQKKNKKLEQIENQAISQQMMLNPDSPHYMKRKFSSLYWGAFSLLNGYISFAGEDCEKQLGSALVATGHAIRSLSHYVARADPLPPGKSIFERAGEKLNEMISDAVRKPVPVRNMTLEDIQ